MKPPCYNGEHHIFEGRFDEVEPKKDSVSRRMDTFFHQSSKDRVYVRDICTKCGSVIDRNQE